MKYLYVLVSNLSDYYSEQAFISIYSLKLKTPNAFVSLLVDNQTAEYLQNNFQELIKSVNELKTVELDSKYSNKEKSRILKTSMRQYIDGDFMFIDCDTVICEDLSDIEKCEFDIACVLDNHVPIHQHWFSNQFKLHAERCGWSESILIDLHFNSGVIYCKDNIKTRDFFKQWNTYWFISRQHGIYVDQASFNQVNAITGKPIHELPGIWNCQLVNGGVKYLSDAKIIHYFASFNPIFGNPFLLDNNILYQTVKNTRIINEEVKQMVYNAKKTIDKNSTLLGSNIPRNVLYMGAVYNVLYLYKNSRFMFKIVEYFSKFTYLLVKFVERFF